MPLIETRLSWVKFEKSFYADQLKTKKKSIKSVSFESIPCAVKDLTQQDVKRTMKADCSKPILKQKVSSANVNINPLRKTKPTLERPQSSRVLSNNIVAHNTALKDRQTRSKTYKKIANPNSILKKTNTTEYSKEKTIVGEAVKRLSKTSTSDMNSLQSSPTSYVKENINRPNTMVKTIVDHQNPVGDFDQWVTDRSFKIQQIHNELNKMVSESMEKYIQSQNETQELEKIIEGEQSKPMQKNIQFENETQELIEGNHLNHERTCESVHVTKEDRNGHNGSTDRSTGLLGEDYGTRSSDSNGHEKPANDKNIEHEYTEDFEEDIDENPVIDSSDSQDSYNQTVAEADSVLSNIIEDITEEEAAHSSSVIDVDKKSDNICEKPKQSTELLSVNTLSKIDIDISLKQNLKETCTTDPARVSTATSPIIFQSSLQKPTALLVNSSTSVEGLYMQVNTATSPIILPKTTSPSAAKIDQSGNKERDFVSSKVQSSKTDGDMQLLAPPVKLIPASLDSVLNLSLNNAETKNPQSTVNLVVHLPHSTSGINNSQPDYTARKSHYSNPCDLEPSEESIFQNSLERNTTNKNETQPVQTVNKEPHSFFNHQSSKEQAIKDIIEPTVAAVFKKMKETTAKNTILPSTSSNTNKVESSSNFEHFTNQCNQVEKPNLTLQYRPGYWYPPVFPHIVSNNTAEASNQTQAETNNASVQVSKYVPGDVVDKASSARKYNDDEDVVVRSYIEKLKAVALSKETVSSESGSSSDDLSSGSRYTSSNKSSSHRSHYGDPVTEKSKLSDGELPGGVCLCSRGEVCSFCVPKLDLSYGELKTNWIDRRKATGKSESESPVEVQPLINLPLHLEPRPSSMTDGGFKLLNKVNSNVNDNTLNGVDIKVNKCSSSENQINPNKSFSDLANCVMKDLRREQEHDKGGKNLSKLANKFLVLNPRPDFLTKSDMSNKNLREPNKMLDFSKTSLRKPLFVKSPLDVPNCDIVVDSSGGSSSYQTSVTSVSVDQCDVATSYSSN